MIFPTTWEQEGLITPALAAAIMRTIFFGVRVQPVTVGSIWWFPNALMQYVNQDPSQGASQFVPCDGSDLSVVSYPDLYAIVGNLYGGDGTHFFVPDLRSMVVIGAGQQPGYSDRILGVIIGEEDHTLNTTEMPTHSHTDLGHTHGYIPALPNATTIGPGAPQPTAVPGISLTDLASANIQDAGANGPHNNMQPSSALCPYIQAFP
jgi:microcystin-dependent protein